MIDQSEVKRIVALARLELADEEVVKLQKDLSSILDFVEQLKGLTLETVTPTTHQGEVASVARADQPVVSFPADSVTAMLAQLPEEEERLLKVPSILP